MVKETQRRFIIGDTWLFYKIYAAPRTSDIILTESIKPLTEMLIKKKIISKWFFIRYEDPENHIRLRLKYSNSDDVGIIINTLRDGLKEFVDEDLIWKIQIDTYQREIERYGASTMDLSETLFYYDSKTVVDFLDLIEGDEGEELRWLFSLKAMDGLLNSFNYKVDQKLYLLRQLKIGFRAEFDTSKVLGKQINDKYRGKKSKIEHFMSLNINDDSEYAPILKILQIKERNSLSTVSQILEFNKNGLMTIELDNFLNSHIHMMMNRIFKSKNRLHEMICYDFLWRHYSSIISR